MRIDRAEATASTARQMVVLPIPASPRSTSARGPSTTAASSTRGRSLSSRSRPTTPGAITLRTLARVYARNGRVERRKVRASPRFRGAAASVPSGHRRSKHVEEASAMQAALSQPLLHPQDPPENAQAPVRLAARDLRRRYGAGDTAVDALRGVSVTVAEGQLTAVMGPSGSG